MAMNRRRMLVASGAALLGPAALGRLVASEHAAPKKVLMFTKSTTFQHNPIARKDGKLGLAEQIVTDMGKEHGFEVVASKDGTMFDPDKIGQWDAFFFYTTGDLTKPSIYDPAPPMSKEGKAALLDAIRGGKAFLGVHSATDTFNHGKGVDPYIEMIGGEFIVHGDQQEVKVDITDATFPGVSGFGSTSFNLHEEWYSFKNLSDDLHVIMAHDTSTFKKHETGSNKTYDRPNFPETWAKMYGKGRVFYTSMGHRDEVWKDKRYQELLLGGMKWATGEVQAEIKPNVASVTPDFKKLTRD